MDNGLSSSLSYPTRLSKRVFVAVVVAAIVFGILSVVLVGVWMGHVRSNGFQWKSGGKFQLHPFVLTLGMSFIFGNSTLCYRVLPGLGVPRRFIKIIHGVMMVVVAALLAFGLYLDFSLYASFKSLHAVMGVVTTILFVLQLLVATFIFALPYAPGSLRASYMWPHSFFGILILVAAAATCLTGTDIMKRSGQEKELSISFGMILATFTAIVVFLLSNESYRAKKPDKKPMTNGANYRTFGDNDPHITSI